MKIFLSLCLLFSLVSPAVLQICTKCVRSHGSECAAFRRQPCDFDERSCKSIIATGNLLPLIPRADYSCGDCEAGNYAFTTGANGSFNLEVRCCKSDECNKKHVEISSEPMEPNGLECIGCYAEEKEHCKGAEFVRCSGNQTMCMKMNVEIVEYDEEGPNDSYSFSARGCATPDMCNEDDLNNNLQVSGKSVSFNVECCNAL